MRLFRFLFSRLFFCISVIAALTAAIIFLCLYIHSLLPAAAAVALAFTLTLACTLHLMRGDVPADFKCCWLILVCLFPVGGAVLYFLSAVSNRVKGSRARALPRCGYSGYRLYFDGEEFLKELTLAISAAERRVYLEFYIISKGYIWGAICRELERALNRGVEVKIIYDGLGSALRAPKAQLKRLKRAGAEIKVFNKLVPLPATRIGFRDHRKLAAIDGRKVFLGGVNLADEYAHVTSPFGLWKDGGIQFTGKIAAVYGEIFLEAFYGVDRAPRYPEEENGADILCDRPEICGSICEDMLTEKIYSAKRRVYIFTPYLCMGDKLYDALAYAARRGVKVGVIIPGIPDKRLPYAVSKAYAGRLTFAGVMVYKYTPGFMHFKGVVCDGGVFLGSYNFDFRSMRLNYENGVYLQGEAADEVAAEFERCTLDCEPYSPRGTIKERLAGYLVKLFAPLV